MIRRADWRLGSHTCVSVCVVRRRRLEYRQRSETLSLAEEKNLVKQIVDARNARAVRVTSTLGTDCHCLVCRCDVC
jgi:hypothetical protein